MWLRVSFIPPLSGFLTCDSAHIKNCLRSPCYDGLEVADCLRLLQCDTCTASMFGSNSCQVLKTSAVGGSLTEVDGVLLVTLRVANEFIEIKNCGNDVSFQTSVE